MQNLSRGEYKVLLQDRLVLITDHNGVRVGDMGRELQAFLSDAGAITDRQLPAEVDNWAATRRLRATQVKDSIYRYKLTRR